MHTTLKDRFVALIPLTGVYTHSVYTGIASDKRVDGTIVREPRLFCHYERDAVHHFVSVSCDPLHAASSLDALARLVKERVGGLSEKQAEDLFQENEKLKRLEASDKRLSTNNPRIKRWAEK